MRSRWFVTAVAVVAVSAAAIYGAWIYVRSVANQAFESDALKVKQSFYEGVKAAESSLQSLDSFVEALGDEVDQTRFGKFAADLMAKQPFLVGSTYYHHIVGSDRALYETMLQARGAGDTIVESGVAGGPAVVPAQVRSEYFVIDAVDAAAKEQTYFGWDVLSDPAKTAALRAAIATDKPQATATFLLDSGNVAFEIFSPVTGGDGELLGVVGATVDLTKLLGEQRWREGVTIIMTTVLAGEQTTKDIYRSVDRDEVRWVALGALLSQIEVENFGQKLGLKFAKVLFPGRVNLTMVGMASMGALLLALLAFYLLFTYDRLQISSRRLAEANETLENKVAERTRDLAVAHAEIKEILDNLDEVVFAVDADQKIGPVYSPASRRLLGRADFAGLDLESVLFKDLDRHDPDASRHLFTLQMASTFDEFQWSLSKSELLPVAHFQVVDGPRRTLSLRYSPVWHGDAISKLIVVASDVTELMALKESLAAREQEAARKDAVLSELAHADKVQLRAFFQALDPRQPGIHAFATAPQADALLPVLRDLHTMKGSGRLVGLHALAKAAHAVEDGLVAARAAARPAARAADTGEAGNQEPLATLVQTSGLADLCRLYEDYRHVFAELFAAPTVAAEPQLLGRILPFLREGRNDRQDLVRWYESASSEGITSVAEVFKTFARPIGDLAKQLGKTVDLTLPAWDLYVDPDLKGVLNEVFTHALRNAVDHGIESPTARLGLHKNPAGRVWLEQETVGAYVHLVIADDGAGVDLAGVHRLARERGLVTGEFAAMASEDVLDLLFQPGFSTKTAVSDVSGRGIGLDAVRTSLGSHGATCRMRSQVGRGTRFEIRLPRSAVRFLATEHAQLQTVA